MRTTETNHNIIFWLFLLTVVFVSCTKMDDYKKYISEEEVIYIGKPDSVRVFSGRDRVQLQWLIISDPKVIGAIVSWKNKTESKTIDIKRGIAVDTIRTYIENLAQGYNTFELHTFDREGNTSIPVYAGGMVYSTNYERTLPNRSVESVRYAVGGNTLVDWRLADSASIGIKLRFFDRQGTERTTLVPNASTQTELNNYDVSKPFTYQTMYKPDSTAVDTFYAAAVSMMANEILLKNAGPPFKGINVSGRWGDLLDWDTNAAIKSRNGGVGGFDGNNGGFISMEYWWSPQIINGKISQTAALPAGRYHYVARVSNIDNKPEATYLAVSAGNSLPNIENINSALGHFKLTDNSLNNKDITVTFTLNTAQTVTLGFVTTMQQVHETSVRIASVKLRKE